MATIYVLGAGHEDAVAFSGLVAGLRQVGYQTCCAEDFSRAGPAAVEHTRAAIELCDAIVLLLSPRSVTSSRPTEQYASMLRKGRPLVAVLVDIKPGQIRNLPPQWHRTLPETARIIAGFRTMEEAASQAADQLKSLGIYSDPGTPTPSSLETSSAAPEKPLPRIPADAIPAARDTMEAERRQVTVLFADVVGFTSMSEKLDPEDTHALISEVVDLITQEVH
ncbi:MAG: adenylate/guanylate cyclase domain-containing protein, partial [Dehalococcoidia bacterium]|nr:adenylate/guanylate cyclase domain-containing protein [Dehalococcoidia bacterium]